MKEEVKVPSVGESIVEGTLMTWYKENGEYVKEGEELYEFETEKASVTVPSTFGGVLEILVPEGSVIKIGQVVAMIDTAAGVSPNQNAPVKKTAPAPERAKPVTEEPPLDIKKQEEKVEKEDARTALSPAVRRIAAETKVDLAGIEGTGKEGRITKGDVLDRIAGGDQGIKHKETPAGGAARAGGEMEKRAPMSYVRKAIATRLVTARQEAAHLTTFNEINMERLLEIRKRHQPQFEKMHGIKLGFMSFFVKAAVAALKEFPVINGRIEGDEIVYYNFYDIGVAVSTDRGLLVPVIRNADSLTYAGIEEKIADLAERAKSNKITLPELMGGTFSITNGGIFGSLMSTPIPNHPQPAILGMHAVQERPVAVQGQVVIKPMMYVALTYDHRLIDGREAVGFLFRIKQYIEDPESMMLDF